VKFNLNKLFEWVSACSEGEHWQAIAKWQLWTRLSAQVADIRI